MTRPTQSDLLRWRSLDAIHALRILADYVKQDESFEPTRSTSTRRVHAAVAGAEWEFLVDGPKFYDTRKRVGGGGAVDLVMYLWRLPFKKAVAMLLRAGI